MVTLGNIGLVKCDQYTTGCDSCAAGWKPNRRQRRGDDRRGAEGQQQPAVAPSCEALFFLFFVLIVAGVLMERLVMFRRVSAMGMHVFVQFLY